MNDLWPQRHVYVSSGISRLAPAGPRGPVQLGLIVSGSGAAGRPSWRSDAFRRHSLSSVWAVTMATLQLAKATAKDTKEVLQSGRGLPVTVFTS